MCQNTPKTPIVIVAGVVAVIVLVVVLGITLINNLNLSNIIRLNEKVASDSANSYGSAEAAEASYVHNHPRNLHKFEMINDDDGGIRNSYNSSSAETENYNNTQNNTMFSHKTDNRIMIDVDYSHHQNFSNQSVVDEEKRNHIVKVI